MILQMQIDEHEMNAGNGHWTVRCRAADLRLVVIASGAIAIAVGRVSLAPNRRAFLRFHRAPAPREASRRDEKVTAGLGFQRLTRRPHGVPERWVFQQKPLTLLPHHGGVVADFPMHDGGDDEW